MLSSTASGPSRRSSAHLGKSRAREAWPLTAEGIASLGIGLLALTWPFVAQGTVLIIAGWGIVTGALELVMALRVPDRAGRWLLITAACFSGFLAGLILILPHSEAGVIASLLGIYALAFGLVVALTAITFRRRHSALRPSALVAPTREGDGDTHEAGERAVPD